MTHRRSKSYMAYLLRLWRVEGDSAWRATLDDPGTGERRGFKDLLSLFAFLQGETGLAAVPEQAEAEVLAPTSDS